MQQLTIIPHQHPHFTILITRIIIAVRTITIIKSHGLTNNKQPLDNSLEILQGSPDTIIKQYEVLTDLIKEFKGKTHGSQSHNLPGNSLQIVVYYEVPEGMRDEIKRMFTIYTRNEIEIRHK